MAEHDSLNDRKLTAALAGLAPRNSSINREQLLYRAGRAAADAEHRRRRPVSLMSTAAGWLAAALSLGLWSAQPAPVIESRAAVPIDGDRIAHREEPTTNTVPATTSLAPTVTVPDPAPQGPSNPLAGRSLPGSRLETALDLQHISRTGRLAIDRTHYRGGGAVVEADSEVPPATYRELMRELSSRSDLL